MSKSRFKARALEYFREVEQSGKDLVITDRGQPVVRITRFVAGPATALKELRGSVLRYDQPTEPIAPEEWEAAR